MSNLPRQNQLRLFVLQQIIDAEGMSHDWLKSILADTNEFSCQRPGNLLYKLKSDGLVKRAKQILFCPLQTGRGIPPVSKMVMYEITKKGRQYVKDGGWVGKAPPLPKGPRARSCEVSDEAKAWLGSSL